MLLTAVFSAGILFQIKELLYFAVLLLLVHFLVITIGRPYTSLFHQIGLLVIEFVPLLASLMALVFSLFSVSEEVELLFIIIL